MLVSVHNNNNKTRPGMSETESHVSASDDDDNDLAPKKKSYFNNQQSSWQNMQENCSWNGGNKLVSPL